ncbi:AAA family ATPase [Microcella sp.]|uniref:AAA family ATPase n=1 Tax=Microcella sp. TaxID=1913979 RepID=UPI00391CC926
MLVAMAGLPGSGKSTVAEELARAVGMPVVSVDPVESAILRAGIDADQPTGLAAYLVAETIADAVVRSGQGVIIDAVNAVAPARDQWVLLGERLGVEVRFVETLCSDANVHRQRLEQRRRDLVHIAEPTWHAVEQSLDEYAPWSGLAETRPRLTLDTVQPLAALVAQAAAFVRS